MAMRKQIIFQLDEADVESFLYCADRVDARQLAERNTVVATVTRMGSFTHPQYGRFQITRKLLNEFVRNFNDNTYGQAIFLDKDHDQSSGAAAEFKRLFIEGNKLRGELEFTPFGVELATTKGYRYLSADYVENYIDSETEEDKGGLLRGAAFTIRPFVKHLDAVQLTEFAGRHEGTRHIHILDPKLIRLLSEETQVMKSKYLALLIAALQGFKLAETVTKQLSGIYESQADALGDDEKLHKALTDKITETGKQLAEQIGDKVVKLDIQLPTPAPDPKAAAKTLTEEQVKEMVAKQLADAKKAADDAAKQLTEKQAAKVKVLTETINADTGLSDTVKAELIKELSEFIGPDMPDDKIKKLAELQLTKANQVAAEAQLMAMGMQIPGHSGSVHITLDDSNQVKKLQETVDQRLGIKTLSDSIRYKNTGGVLQEQNKQLAERVLAQYDAYRAKELREEAKLLAGGAGVVADVAVPASFERTVIREALYGLNGLQFVNVGTEQFHTSYYIPYSYRDTTAAGRSNTRRYEGQAIARAGVVQTGDNVYHIPSKLAIEVSDELRYLTSNGQLQWNALTENQQNASRIIREDLEGQLWNEQLNSADEYGAVQVVAENLELQADDALNVFILAQFPVVRPRKVYDHAGAQVGNTLNPITVTYNAVALSEYDGTGTQAAGTYYSLDYNLGEIRLVDEAGAVQVPVNATAYTITYSYATNVAKFDSDLGALSIEDKWDTFLTTLGNRKTVIEDQRWHMANFGLMSGTLENSVGQAKKFAANFKRPGTDLSVDGNIGQIKNVAHYKTVAPGLNMGDQRTLIGERGVTRFRMVKPWMMGELENQKDSNGLFTGKKTAYGDQFVVVHTPTPLKRAVTSTVVYSATARVARTV